MDPYRNPFEPGAGLTPPELAGRDAVLEAAKIACGRALAGRSARSMMLLGLRGTGKTALLSEIAQIGKDAGFLVSQIEAPEGDSLAKLLIPELRKVMASLSTVTAAKQVAERAMRGLRGFASAFKIKIAGIGAEVKPEPGLADSGDIQIDLPDLFTALGDAAVAANKGWLISIDEVQYLDGKDLSALIVALHKVAQNKQPILFVGAGLPQVAKLAGDAKSYAERLFFYYDVVTLDAEATARAIEKPIHDEEAEIEQAALDLMVKRTQGYPFFIQQWAAMAWDVAEGNCITLADAERSFDLAIEALDDGFFKVRIDRLTKAEIGFVRVMASLGDGPYAMADIATEMERTQTSLGPMRATIIKKGMIYSSGHGMVDFTVPLFADFVRRSFANSAA